MTVVICLRDPDSKNEFRVFGEPTPIIIDVDYGYLDLRNPTEYAEWRAHLLSQQEWLSLVKHTSAQEAAEFIGGLILEADAWYGEGGEK
jgi:hypothetical protein